MTDQAGGSTNQGAPALRGGATVSARAEWLPWLAIPLYALAVAAL